MQATTNVVGSFYALGAVGSGVPGIALARPALTLALPAANCPCRRCARCKRLAAAAVDPAPTLVAEAFASALSNLGGPVWHELLG